MEAQRLQRQRRESAKIGAATSLPSTQDKKFNLRLIDLYGKHECLWNTALEDYENVELKHAAWDDICSQLGSHLSTSFVRSRLSSLRNRLNVYKLQIIESKMSPGSVNQPEKPHYIDNFAFLEKINMPQQLEPHQSSDSDLHKSERKSSESIASIFKQRLQQQQQMEPLVLQHQGSTHRQKLTSNGSQDDSSDVCIASVVQKRYQQQQQLSSSNMVITQKNSYKMLKLPESLVSARRLLQKALEERQQHKQLPTEVKESLLLKKSNSISQVDSMLKQRMQRLSLIERGRESSTLASLNSFSDIPTVVKKRKWQQLAVDKQHSSETENFSSQSFSKLPEKLLGTSSPLRALPGDSISKTKMEKYFAVAKQFEAGESQHHSDDDDLYRLHWSVRKQNRSRRQSTQGSKRDVNSQPMPRLLLGSVTTSACRMERSPKSTKP